MPNGGVLSIAVRNVDVDQENAQRSTFKLAPGPFIEISVIDTGVGISDKIIGKIFDPFFTTKAIGEGSGIGLATTYGVVTEHGGSLDVCSELNIGSHFRMLLPCYVADDEQTSEPILDQAAIAAPFTGTILLVEDEALLREVLGSMLQALGHRVVSAKDGADAVDIYRRDHDKIDLVLMDLNMPHMDGKQAMAQLRKINPACRAIAMTGFVDPAHFDDVHLEGVAVLKKPIALEGLSQALTRTAQGAPARKART